MIPAIRLNRRSNAADNDRRPYRGPDRMPLHRRAPAYQSRHNSHQNHTSNVHSMISFSCEILSAAISTNQALKTLKPRKILHSSHTSIAYVINDLEQEGRQATNQEVGSSNLSGRAI
jgi:hypothetical protein